MSEEIKKEAPKKAAMPKAPVKAVEDKAVAEPATTVGEVKQKVQELKATEVPEHLKDLKEAVIDFAEDVVGNVEAEKPAYKWVRGHKVPLKK